MAAYYAVHEGAHLLYALWAGVFQQVRCMGLGMQVVVDAAEMRPLQLGIFCAVGAVFTAAAAYALTLAAPWICARRSRLFRACMYYITIAMLLIDPLYLSVLCGFFGGGDMNGIALLVPELPARLFFGVLFAVNCLIFRKIILPKYKQSFAQKP